MLFINNIRANAKTESTRVMILCHIIRIYAADSEKTNVRKRRFDVF